ncbi:MAG: glycerol-3-phosphate dehydrogenase [Burkholderiales bacterium]|nr:glycerol-3-phosphate dehydrogenase [Burkholderiales bacterium]
MAVDSSVSSSAVVSSQEGAALVCDVLVIGGGINGVGTARDLAGRGWNVLLCEQDDLASHTSSASTKLIHGGLRYLEYGEFGLVRKALAERERLLRSAPHIMSPLRFVLPHDASMRPAWMIRLGLWLYDHLAKREFLPGCKSVRFKGHALGAPLAAKWTKGFIYSDGWVDDARLVSLCALDAAERGARILTRTRCENVRAHQGGWLATLVTLDPVTGAELTRQSVQARAVVNAAGPWAERVLHQNMGVSGKDAGRRHDEKLRLVKGSHIVVLRKFAHDHAYIFQGQDRRIIFAIPYQQDFTLIGTTDVEHKGEPGKAVIDQDEITYLCEQASRYLKDPVKPSDVVWTFSGVRPLLDDESGNAAAVTRDYKVQAQRDPAPWLTVWGGKLTTFRLLSQEAADKVGQLLGDERQGWTDDAILPGGDLRGLVGSHVHPEQDLNEFVSVMRQRLPRIDTALLHRWVHAYGSRTLSLLEGVKRMSDLGSEIAPGLYEIELNYLRQHEWAMTAEDVLWRRSKLGLHYTEAQRQSVADWMQQHPHQAQLNAA